MLMVQPLAMLCPQHNPRAVVIVGITATGRAGRCGHLPLNSGVPQGTVLSPTFFLLARES